MAPRDVLTAIAVAVVWGLTFIAIKIGVAETTPLALSALSLRLRRAAAGSVRAPAESVAGARCPLRPVHRRRPIRPAVRRRARGLSVGLASLVIQLQAFFTILFAWALRGERPTQAQAIGAAIAFAGIALIGSERLGGASLGPLLLVIAAAAFWGAGNVVTKIAGKIDMLAFVAWSSLVAPAPLFLAALGWTARRRSLGSPIRAAPGRLRARAFLRRDDVRLRPVVAAAGAPPGRRGRALRAAGADRRHGRRASSSLASLWTRLSFGAPFW